MLCHWCCAVCCCCVQIEDSEAEGVLEPGTAPEIATYLIISAAQVGHVADQPA